MVNEFAPIRLTNALLDQANVILLEVTIIARSIVRQTTAIVMFGSRHGILLTDN